MKELKIEVVANGFVLYDAETMGSAHNMMRLPLDKIQVFNRPAELVAFLEKWAVERKKEMGK